MDRSFTSREDFEKQPQKAKEQAQARNKLYFDELIEKDSSDPVTKPASNEDVKLIMKNKEKKNTRRAYAKVRDGKAFVDNDRLLFECNELAKRLAFRSVSDEAIAQKLEHHASVLNQMLTTAQNKNLVEYIKNKIAKHEAVNKVEAAILRQRDKNLWYLWGIVKLECLVGETVCMSLSQWPSIAQFRKQEAKNRYGRSVQHRISATQSAAYLQVKTRQPLTHDQTVVPSLVCPLLPA